MSTNQIQSEGKNLSVLPSISLLFNLYPNYGFAVAKFVTYRIPSYFYSKYPDVELSYFKNDIRLYLALYVNQRNLILIS